MNRSHFSLFCSLSILLLAGCSGNGGGGNPPPPPTGVTVTPTSAMVNKGGMQTFSATVSGTTDQSVFWEIVEAVPHSGDTTHGFISSSGVYVAPTTVPNPASVTIKALSGADPTKSGTAGVTIQTGSSVSVSISPSSARVQTFGTQQFGATVTGNANINVTWKVNGTSGGPTTGAISSSGLFTAPNSVPVQTNGNNAGQTTEVVVTATSVADTTASDSALVTIFPPQQKQQPAPTPMGVSGSNAKATSTSGGVTFCCGGTLGSLVSRGGNLYILSNNHVLANSDAGTTGVPNVGDPITQPGLVDNNCAVPPTVATLTQFFNLENGPSPKIDAALALIANQNTVDTSGTILQLGGANAGNQPTDGAPHAGPGVAATVGTMVAKSGRSTGLTCSSIAAMGVATSVEYQKGCGTGSTFSVTYANQIGITNNGFTAEGDSGSLIVTQSNSDPVGLFFAGNATDVLGNPVSDVLNGLADPNTHAMPSFAGSATTHPVAACSLPGPQAATRIRLAVQRSTASTEALQSALQARDAQAPELMANPKVQAVGVGASYDNPAEPAILFFVTKGQPRANIPAQIGGVRTRIIEGDVFAKRGALSANDSAELEQTIPPPQIVYAISDAEVARAKVVHAAHSEELMRQPGVQGVGITSSMDSPGEAALMIYLISGVPRSPIPPVIDGLRTRVRESARFRAGFGEKRLRAGCSVAPTPNGKANASQNEPPKATNN